MTNMLQELRSAARIATVLLDGADELPDVCAGRIGNSYGEPPLIKLQLGTVLGCDRDARTWERVRAWAQHLGVQPHLGEITTGRDRPFREVSATAQIDGVTVRVWDHVSAAFALEGSVAA
jgi:hypothetical protein